MTKFLNRITAYCTVFTLLLFPYAAHASFISYFKEDGETNWQYVANFSSGVLIILLSITVISLFITSRRTKKANRALRAIRGALEQQVEEGSASLAEAIEKLKASEIYIKNILTSMPSMLVGLNKHMEITQWNLCAVETTGISYKEAIGKNLWEAYPAITISQQQVEEVIEEQKPATIKHNQRGQYYFNITIYPLKSDTETGVVILIDDVTQRSLAENKLIQRDKMASMGELASSMAHDINIPLQAIINDLSNLQTTIEANDNQLQATIQDATNYANQAAQIIGNLLVFSQSNQRKKRDEDIREILDSTLELAKNSITDVSGLQFKDIVIEKDYQADTPNIPCYRAELKQVFLSLFRHACHALGKAKHGDNPMIKIKVLTCYDSLWIKVQHNGEGLTGQEQHEIFEPFFYDKDQGNISAIENRLSFSQFIIVEHHEGHIFVTSDIDIGSTFHIEFQLA